RRQRSYRPRGNRGDARRLADREQLPAHRRSALRNPGAVRHVHRRHVPRAHRARRLRRERSKETGAQGQGRNARRDPRQAVRRVVERVFRKQKMKIEISIPRQELVLFDGARVVKRYAVSTAKKGAGEKNGSLCTPRGRHIIRAKIGAGQAPNTVFVRRRPTGETWSPELHARFPGRDWMLTRILWLSGKEAGRNRLGDVDTMRR